VTGDSNVEGVRNHTLSHPLGFALSALAFVADIAVQLLNKRFYTQAIPEVFSFSRSQPDSSAYVVLAVRLQMMRNLQRK
jgi:hypothetical protein